MEVVGIFGIRGGVLDFEESRFTSIIRLEIEQYLGTSTPSPKDRKRRLIAIHVNQE